MAQRLNRPSDGIVRSFLKSPASKWRAPWPRVESERKLTGDRLATALRGLAELEATLQWVPITESIILLASGPLPTVIKALDAIHLATAIAVRDAGASDLVFATHDRRQATAAAAMGFEVVGV